MAGGTRVPVLISQCPGRLVIRPVGACTIAIAGIVQDRVERCRRPENTDVYFDLSQAKSLDSTFAGLLLSLVTSKADSSVPDVHLLNPSPQAIDALQRMHVFRLFRVCSSMPDPPTDWQELTGDATNREQMADLVVDSHQQLIDADPRNILPFRRVVEGLGNPRSQSAPEDTDR